MARTAAFIMGIACSVSLLSVFPAAERAEQKPRIHGDPKGRFSFHLVGDWVKLKSEDQEGIVAIFLFTRKDGESRKVAAEMLISTTESRPSIRLEDYVRAEDRRLVNSPGFGKLGEEEKLTVGGQPALKNRYTLSPPGEPEETKNKVIYQYYTLKNDVVWGITLSARQQDEAVLSDVERTAISSFEFSVPEGASAEPSLEVFKRVTVTGARGGFSLNVPEKWEVKQSEEEGAFIRGPGAVVHAFCVAQEGEHESPHNVANLFLKERENLKNLQVLSQGLEDVAARKGYVVEYSGVGEGRQWRVRLVALVEGGKAFFIHCVVPVAGWDGSKDVLTRIGESFAVIAPAAKAEGGT